MRQCLDSEKQFSSSTPADYFLPCPLAYLHYHLCVLRGPETRCLLGEGGMGSGWISWYRMWFVAALCSGATG